MEKEIKTKIYYSKNFKRAVLFAIARGEKAYDFFVQNGYDINKLLKNDKKYLLKLISKWKKEMYQNREILYFNNKTPTKKDIQQELSFIGDETYEDIIEKSYNEEFENINNKLY